MPESSLSPYMAAVEAMSGADKASLADVLALRRRIAQRIEALTKRTITDLHASPDRNLREAIENAIRIDGMLAVTSIMAEEFTREVDGILARYRSDS